MGLQHGKDESLVQCPFKLDMSEFLPGVEESMEYKLYATIQHHGDLGSNSYLKKNILFLFEDIGLEMKFSMVATLLHQRPRNDILGCKKQISYGWFIKAQNQTPA